MDGILLTVNPLGLWRTRYHFGTSFIRKNPPIQRRKNEKSFVKRKKTSYNEWDIIWLQKILTVINEISSQKSQKSKNLGLYRMRYLFARKKAAGGENLKKNPLICKKKRMRYHLSIQKNLYNEWDIIWLRKILTVVNEISS